MSPVDLVELSALLDDELSAPRAQEVRRALATDPSLRATYEHLAKLDTKWKTCAAQLAFRPRVSLVRGLFRRRLCVASAVLSLLVLRLAMKLAPPFLGAGVALIVFTFFVGWGLRYLLRASEEDCWWLARRPADPVG